MTSPDAPTSRAEAPDGERWQDVLAALEGETDAAEAALRTDLAPPGGALVLPTVMPPLPAELHERAWAVYDRTRAVVEALARAAHAAQDELSGLDAQQAGRPPASYVDSRC